nr:antileukoproteinase-like [Penaeus vannamei]
MASLVPSSRSQSSPFELSVTCNMMIRVLLLVGVAAVVALASGNADGCRYYCEKWRPEGEERPVYCCDDGTVGDPPPVEDHSGECPDVRRHCLRFKRPPNVCPHDGFCPSNQKCCWDTCLDHHACKLPV